MNKLHKTMKNSINKNELSKQFCFYISWPRARMKNKTIGKNAIGCVFILFHYFIIKWLISNLLFSGFIFDFEINNQIIDIFFLFIWKRSTKMQFNYLCFITSINKAFTIWFKKITINFIKYRSDNNPTPFSFVNFFFFNSSGIHGKFQWWWFH